MVVRVVAAVLGATAFLGTAAQADATADYNVRDYTDGTGSAGSSTGTHQVSGSGGTITTSVAGGGNPSVEVTGSLAAGHDAYLYGTADYDYDLMLSAISTTVGNELAAESASNGNQIIGHLSGFLRVSATMNSTANVRFATRNPQNGDSSTLTAACSGYICSGPAGFASGTLIPVTLDVHLYSFDFGCALNPYTGVMEGNCTTGTTQVHMSVDGTLRSAPGLSGGSLDAYIDPVFTLDDTFLQNHGLTADSFTISQDSVDSPSPAPEPVSWAMMVGGFGLIGGALRTRGRKNAFSA